MMIKVETQSKENCLLTLGSVHIKVYVGIPGILLIVPRYWELLFELWFPFCFQ